MGEIVDNIQSEETVEQRSDRAYQEAMETVKGTSKVTATEGKEGHSNGQETPMTVQTVPTLDSDGKKGTLSRSRKPATTTKSVDAQSIVEKMREQIACIEYIAGIDIPEIVTPNSKEAREILIKLQKDMEKCKAEAITAIQAL